MKPNDRIRQARIRGGLSQVELADRAACHQSDISDLERLWEGSPRFRQRIAEAVGVELSAAEVVAEPNPSPSKTPRSHRGANRAQRRRATSTDASHSTA
jgi:transcriptional regulator with XRE-family HTH domain